MQQFRHLRLSGFFSWEWALVVAAVCLIFWKLGEVPHGMTVDEAAIGYNGYAVVTTRRDEWLTPIPISFRSYGDYKAPLAIYINGLFTVIFGLKLWVVRLPFAISGVIAVWTIQYLIRLLYSQNHPLSSWSAWTPVRASWVAGGLLLTTPWFLHFARTGFESGMALTFLLIGMTGLSKVLFENTTKKAWLVLIPALSLTAAMYTYHSAKIVVPLMVVSFLLLHRHRVARRLKQLAVMGGVIGALLVPLVYDTVLGHGGTRFTQTTIFSETSNPAIILQRFFVNLMSHLDPRFLVGGLTTTLRHGDGQWGVLLPVVFGLWLIGVVSIIFWRNNYGTKRLWAVGMVWTGIGLLPALLGSEVPHSNRALMALPGVIITVLLGIEFLATQLYFWKVNRRIKGSHNEKHIVMKAVLGTLLLVHVLTVVAYLHHYYTDFAKKSVDAYQDGYLEAFKYIMPYEKGADGYEAERILFTNHYSQPYMYALFARKTSPIRYNQGSLIKYQFVDFENTSALLRDNTIVVTAPEDNFPLKQASHVIYGSDGLPRFIIYVNRIQ